MNHLLLHYLPKEEVTIHSLLVLLLLSIFLSIISSEHCGHHKASMSTCSLFVDITQASLSELVMEEKTVSCTTSKSRPCLHLWLPVLPLLPIVIISLKQCVVTTGASLLALSTTNKLKPGWDSGLLHRLHFTSSPHGRLAAQKMTNYNDSGSRLTRNSLA